MSNPAATRSATSKIDLLENGDYPIVLGNSLKDAHQSRSKFIQLRYNWEPSNGFHKQNGTLKQSNGNVRLAYRDPGSSSTSYNLDGYVPSSGGDGDGKDLSRLVLIFDESKSAFVLETISAAVDLNMISSVDISKDELQRKRQLRPLSSSEATAGSQRKTQDDDERPDPNKPFDFRHFLHEAKESMDKSSVIGSGTPVLGSCTPMSRASPSIGGLPSNPSSILPTSTTSVSSKSKATQSRPSKVAASRKSAPNRKEPAIPKSTTKALSKERIEDSDEEVSDTVAVGARANRGHVRQTSSPGSISRSPNILVSEGGLEIDMGSEPQKPAREKYKFDPEIFRSQTHTPVMGSSSNHEPPARAAEDVMMKDASPSESDDEDGDVDEFELEDRNARKIDKDPPEPVDTPPAYRQDDEDYDDDLEKELLVALEEEENSGTNGAINDYGPVDDDESEVSEEE